jgi:hypothetical protein
MKLNFFIYCAVFITLAILANWFWFPEYLLLGIFTVSVIAIITGFIIGVSNTIKDADSSATKKE